MEHSTHNRSSVVILIGEIEDIELSALDWRRSLGTDDLLDKVSEGLVVVIDALSVVKSVEVVVNLGKFFD